MKQLDSLLSNFFNLRIHSLHRLTFLSGSLLLLIFLLNPVSTQAQFIYLQSKDYSARTLAAQNKLSAYAAIGSNPAKVSIRGALVGNAIPTNRIWSSAVYGSELQGLFTYPLQYRTNEGQLQFGVPGRIVESDYMYSYLKNYISVYNEKDTVSGITNTSVIDYRDLSVKLSMENSAYSRQFVVTAVQGSPIAFITPSQRYLTLDSNILSITDNKNGTWNFKFNTTNYVMGTNAVVTRNGTKLTLDFANVKGYVNIGYSGPNNEAGSYLQQVIHNSIDTASARFWNNLPNQTSTTTYDFSYSSQSRSQDSLFGFLPHQMMNKNSVDCIYKINTLRGDQCMYKLKTSTSYTAPIQPLTTSLGLDTLGTTQQADIMSALNEDIAETDLGVNTSYFGGKEVARLARMIEIADELNQYTTATKIRAQLKSELINWFTYTPGENGKYFMYDAYRGGLIGQNPDFGVDNYNDHHFHYGYFLYAAGVIAERDSDFLIKYKPFVDQLALDIANNSSDTVMFPRMRVFDFYESHSWASGDGRSVDGNNQESSSEAVFAWYGLWRWSKASKNDDIKNTAIYLYSSEINATRFYWLNRSGRSDIFPEGYNHNTAGIVWGGKVTYSTFFSDLPSAVKGIQFIPFTAASMYLNEPEYVNRDYQEIKQFLSDTESPLYDHNIMYISVVPKLAQNNWSLMMDTPAHNGNSKANMLSWIYYWQKYGSNY